MQWSDHNPDHLACLPPCHASILSVNTNVACYVPGSRTWRLIGENGKKQILKMHNRDIRLNNSYLIKIKELFLDEDFKAIGSNRLVQAWGLLDRRQEGNDSEGDQVHTNGQHD